MKTGCQLVGCRTIAGNWANALYMSASSTTRAGGTSRAPRPRKKPAVRPSMSSVSELEALRIDILQGGAAQALPEVETRLAQVEAWWRQHRAGERRAGGAQCRVLARALISALDIATQGHRAQKDWESALRRIDAILEVKRALQRPAEDIADTRMNRAVVLGVCAASAKQRPSWRVPPRSSRTILPAVPRRSVPSPLYSPNKATWPRPSPGAPRPRPPQELPDPGTVPSRTTTSPTYLEPSGTPSALAEFPRHQLAALIYRLVSGLGQDLQNTLHNYVITARPRGRHSGSPARVAELLTDPGFRPLDDWLRQRQADVGRSAGRGRSVPGSGRLWRRTRSNSVIQQALRFLPVSDSSCSAGRLGVRFRFESKEQDARTFEAISG